VPYASYVVVAAPDPGGSSVNGTTGAILVIGALVAIVISIAIFFGRGHRRQVSTQQALSDDVAIGLTFLAEQLAGIDASASVAASDAWNRLATARGVAANGDAIPVLRATRHTLLEGLAAAHVARTEAGLDPGPVPPSPSEVPTTEQAAEIVVDGLVASVWPMYRPGFVHHFPGGTIGRVAIPGGWYAEPFWERLLLSDADESR
jgi:hypothetical protein